MQYLKSGNSSFIKWKWLTSEEDGKEAYEPFMSFFIRSEYLLIH